MLLFHHCEEKKKRDFTCSAFLSRISFVIKLCRFICSKLLCICPPAVFGCNLVAQTELVKATTAIESAVFVTMQWLTRAKPSSGLLYTIAEELRSQVKKMGGYFQMLIQVNAHTKECHRIRDCGVTTQ